MTTDLQYLKSQTADLPGLFQKLADVVLDDPRFTVWPGSCDKHHPYDGGLIEHTSEVFSGCVFPAINNAKVPLDITVLKVAAIWHDYGKIWDYERNPLYLATDQEYRDRHGGIPNQPTREETRWPWRKTSHYGKVRHLTRSYAEFLRHAEPLRNKNWPMTPEITDAAIEAISHCILAHHGRLEWGSPVEPKTPEAWALHLSDMMSVKCLARVKSLQ